ncbi:galactoside alpha-(1,2)-fucosyltransferase 2-like isoform X3 [Dendropsophus ebraccatus]|uniref:galactoside alpha-(1,2)-fucosyltransferase 2-like isoform X3 n=1 Tax=Dendropsophus ebraccatus TaxID=150705 RepID=UPI0038321B19
MQTLRHMSFAAAEANGLPWFPGTCIEPFKGQEEGTESIVQSTKADRQVWTQKTEGAWQEGVQSASPVCTHISSSKPPKKGNKEMSSVPGKLPIMRNHLPRRALVIFLLTLTFYFWYLYRRLIMNFLISKNSKKQSKNFTSDTVIWTAHPSARLGNKMGEYAVLYALAKLNGHRAYILPQMQNELGKIFKISLPVLPQEVADSIQWREYNIQDWMSPEYLNISGQYVKLFGTPCSWTFYHHIREEILREFTFHDKIKDEANSHLKQLKGTKVNVTYVGVHVRRGDYVEVMPKKRKGVVADKNYLQQAMDYFRRKYANPLFVVTSNGMDWCRKNIDNTLGDVYFVGNGIESSPAQDLALLAHCNHTIMTIGTFGYWAAYLVGVAETGPVCGRI